MSRAESCRQPRFEDQDTGQITGNITTWTENRSWRYGYQAKLSHLTDEVLGGRHDLKVGIQYVRPRRRHHHRQQRPVSHQQQDREADDRHDAAALSRRRRPRKSIGTYFDDTLPLWQRRHQLRRALRLQQGDVSRTAGPRCSGQPTGQMSPANDDVYHWNTFSPRVGINYKVNDSGKTVVKAHYGRYYKLLEASEFRAAVPSVTTLFNFTGDFGGPRTNISPVAAANLRIDPNFKSPYNDQFIVQLEQQLRGEPRPAGELRAQERRRLRRLAGHRRAVRLRCRTSTTRVSTRPGRP